MNKLILKEVCKHDLHFFVRQCFKVTNSESEFQNNWHIEVMCKTLQDFYFGKIEPKLDINVGPRLLKSYVANVCYPLWVWLHEPSHKFINASYVYDLALEMLAKRNKILESGFYKSISKIKIIKDRQDYIENSQGGFFKAASTGGKITGSGADCLIGSTKVFTNLGEMTIRECHEVFQLTKSISVLSFNHETKKAEFMPVVATRKTKSNQTVTTKFDNGESITSTCDHRIFDLELGYVSVFSQKKNKIKALSLLQKRVCKKEDWALSKLFVLGKKLCCRDKLFSLQKDFQKKTCRLFKGNIFQKAILFRDVPKEKRETSLGTKKVLHKLRKSHKNKKQKAVRNVPISWSNRIREAKSRLFFNVHVLWKYFFIKVKKKNPLFFGMQKQKAFERHEGPVESKSQKNQKKNRFSWKLFLQKNKKRDFVKRFILLRLVWIWRKHSRSSYRSQLEKQQKRKSNIPLRLLSFVSPQKETIRTEEAISVFQELHKEEVEVFDLQVEGNENFFANGILVHNCLIGDDLLDVEAAFSNAERRKSISWIENTFYDRYNDPRRVWRLNINHRVHKEDASNFYQTKKGFKVLAFQLEKTKRVFNNAVHYDDPRKQGELLFPDRVSEEIRQDVASSPYLFSTKWQQDPQTLAAGLLKEHHLVRYKTLPPKFVRKMIFVDSADSDKITSDYCCYGLWGQDEQGRIYLIDILRFKGEYHKQKELLMQFSRLHNCHLIEIEPKSSGRSLISGLKNDKQNPFAGVKEWEVDGLKVSKLSKVERMDLCLEFFNLGLVLIPDLDDSKINLYVSELLGFTREGSLTGNDDQVDMTTMAVLKLLFKKRGGVHFA